MPDFSIDSFKSNFDGGGARQYLFYYTPNFPPSVGGNAEKATYLVRTTTAPANTIEEMTVNWQGYDFKVGGRNTFEDFTVTFNVDKGAEVIQWFYDWMKICHDPETNVHADNLSSYMIDQKLQMIGLDGNTVMTYTMYDAWVKSVAGVSMDYSSNDISQFDVGLSYSWHKIERG